MVIDPTAAAILALLPPWLRVQLSTLVREIGGELYLAGGVVRDLLRGQRPEDIDLTVASGARIWAGKLAALTGGTYVPLGREEDAARVVSRKTTIDISAFREGTTTIQDDLVRRDLTVNAMAIRIDPLLRALTPDEACPVALLDPTGGRGDLQQEVIRAASVDSFVSDPLRLLRVFRFAATLGFSVEATTLDLVRRQRSLLAGPAPERVTHEMDLILSSGNSPAVLNQMAGTGVLWEVIPELAAGIGMEQPRSHHLDVWSHNLETLRCMEQILRTPERWFPEIGPRLISYLDVPHQHRRLRWAALLHDVGKPATRVVRADRGNRITFYNHDRVGADLFRDCAIRWRWSNEERERVAQLIDGHMHPFHLANVARDDQLTLRAAIRMIRRAGAALPGLFLLAMADSLAGQGEERVEGMERELAELYGRLERIRLEYVEPVQATPPLLTGRDLIERLGLQPGPMFKRILGAIEEARMEGSVHDAADALQLAREMSTDTSD
jgi:poly(A) polymerase